MAIYRVGVFSDSHGNRAALKSALALAGRLDAAVFLGDGCADTDLIDGHVGSETICVRGNNDFFCDCDAEKTVELYGVRFFCAHGHQLSLYLGTEKLERRALECGADVALFGHTHRSLLKKSGGLLVLNPGSVGEARDGLGKSYAVIEIEDKRPRASIFKFR